MHIAQKAFSAQRDGQGSVSSPATVAVSLCKKCPEWATLGVKKEEVDGMLKAAVLSAASLQCGSLRLVYTINAMTRLLLGAVLLGSLGVTVQGNLM